MQSDPTHWLRGPVPLCPDNFTSLERTPWAGLNILRSFKAPEDGPWSQSAVGESWEFSCAPEMPSRLRGTNLTLSALMDLNPDLALSPEIHKGTGCRILVKLISAATPLSFQVHPEDLDPNLRASECGKPESWLILSAEEGAGIYLGFKKPFSREALRDMLIQNADLSPMLQFIPVRENDYFEIAPGVAHAIGAGVTLLEPQRIIPGKSGKTYRLWDWNRLYDAAGHLKSDEGSPRELHINEGIRLLHPESDFGAEWATSLRKSPTLLRLTQDSRILCFEASSCYQTQRVWPGVTPGLKLSFSAGFGALIPLCGPLLITSESGKSLTALTGQPVFLPYGGEHYYFCSKNPAANFALVTPPEGRWTWQPGITGSG